MNITSEVYMMRFNENNKNKVADGRLKRMN